MCHCADTCREPGHYKPRCPRLRGDGLARVPCVSGTYCCLGGPLRVCAAAWHRQRSAGGDRVSASTSAGERVSAVPRGQRPAITCHALEYHVRARVQVGKRRPRSGTRSPLPKRWQLHRRTCSSWSPSRQPTPRASRKFQLAFQACAVVVRAWSCKVLRLFAGSTRGAWTSATNPSTCSWSRCAAWRRSSCAPRARPVKSTPSRVRVRV